MIWQGMELLKFLERRIRKRSVKTLVSKYVKFFPMLGSINRAKRASTDLKRAVTPRPSGGVAFVA